MSEVLLGLDVGGGSCRCTSLAMETGRIVTSTRPFSASRVPDGGGIAFDLDLDGIWTALASATRETLERGKIDPGNVIGIATTAMRLGTVLLGPDDQTLMAVPNRDARAVLVGFQLATEHGEELAARTGHWPAPMFAAPRLLRLATEEPRKLAVAQSLLSISDWMTWKLCGEHIAEPSQAGESLLFDLETRDWMWDWIDRWNLPRSLFPAVRESGQLAGALLATPADALGLRAGTPVAIGGADTQCGLLGVGASRPGDIALIAGTTAPVQQVVERPLVDPERRLWTGHHIVPGRWVVESNAGPAGEALSWFARVLFPEDRQPEARLLGEADRAEPGAAGLLSSFGAQVFDGRNLGLPVGDLTLTHLSSQSDRAPRRHLVRALIEGLACAVRANREQISQVTGSNEALRMGGGLSRSDTFVRITAEVLGTTTLASEVSESSGFGAALCAGVGTGIFADLEEASDQAKLRTLDPDAPAREASEGVYGRWNELHAARRDSQAMIGGFVVPYALADGSAPLRNARLGTRPKVLICADFDAQSLERLREIADVEYAPFREKLRLLSGDSLVKALQGVEIFVTEIDLVDAAALSQLPDLRVVGACRGDAVNVDVAACSAYGIPVVHAPGRNADAVADLTVAFLLSLARKLPQATRFLRSGDITAGDMGKMGQAFGTLRGRELFGKTVGLVGLGAVGRAVARRLDGFGARLLVADPFVSAEQAALTGAESVTLEELLAQSDFVSLHAAVVDATRGMIDAQALAQMKPGACLINTARAALTDEQALVDALASKRLAGAAFDTFAIEPPGSDHPLLDFENVIVTPHVGGNTEEVATHQGRIIVDEFERLLSGSPPLHALDAQALDDFDFAGPRRAVDEQAIANLGKQPGPAVTDLQKPQPKAAAAPTKTARPAAAAAAPTPEANDIAETRTHMRRILASFLERSRSDDRLRSFAAGRDVTLHFDLVDLEIEFYLRIREAGIEGQLGAPPERAPVELRMRADVLDGMFTGRGDPMKDAMEGRLSFTGDAGKAMALQELQSDFQRLYMATLAELGEPGDLSSLGDSDAAAPEAASAPGLATELVSIVEELYGSQLITATGGNVSARIEESSEAWITPSQLFKGDLTPDLLVRIGMDGRALGTGTRSPSSEWGMHCAVYRARPDVNAVIHAHAPNATILANSGLPFLPISTEAAFFGDLPRIPFVMPGTPELASAIGEALTDGWAVLMQNHGLLVAGRSLRRAADMAEIIERTSEVILGCYAVGSEPPTLPDEIVAELRRMGDLVA